MAEYTPTTSEVMAAYVIGEHLTQPVFPVAETEQCFRNWLAEHDRVVAAKAWDEATKTAVETIEGARKWLDKAWGDEWHDGQNDGYEDAKRSVTRIPNPYTREEA